MWGTEARTWSSTHRSSSAARVSPHWSCVRVQGPLCPLFFFFFSGRLQGKALTRRAPGSCYLDLMNSPAPHLPICTTRAGPRLALCLPCLCLSPYKPRPRRDITLAVVPRPPRWAFHNLRIWGFFSLQCCSEFTQSQPPLLDRLKETKKCLK